MAMLSRVFLDFAVLPAGEAIIPELLPEFHLFRVGAIFVYAVCV